MIPGMVLLLDEADQRRLDDAGRICRRQWPVPRQLTRFAPGRYLSRLHAPPPHWVPSKTARDSTRGDQCVIGQPFRSCIGDLRFLQLSVASWKPPDSKQFSVRWICIHISGTCTQHGAVVSSLRTFSNNLYLARYAVLCIYLLWIIRERFRHCMSACDARFQQFYWRGPQKQVAIKRKGPRRPGTHPYQSPIIRGMLWTAHVQIAWHTANQRQGT